MHIYIDTSAHTNKCNPIKLNEAYGIHLVVCCNYLLFAFLF